MNRDARSSGGRPTTGGRGKSGLLPPKEQGVFEVEGRYILEAKLPNGDEVHLKGKNLIVSAGRLALAKLMLNLGNMSPPSHLVLGSGTAVPALSDVALTTEQYAFDIIAGGDFRDAVLAADQRQFTLQMDVTAQETYAGAPFTLNEIGIFGRVGGRNAVMFSRFLVQTFSFLTGTKFTFSWALSFKDKA